MQNHILLEFLLGALGAQILHKGVQVEDEQFRPDSTAVFSFPIKAPVGAITRDDKNAIEQCGCFSRGGFCSPGSLAATPGALRVLPRFDRFGENAVGADQTVLR